MPSKTPKQARAMRAAAAGDSRLGIPKSVGQEYVSADRRAKAGNLAAMRSPYPKAEAATRNPDRPDRSEKPIGRRGMVKGGGGG